MCCGCEGKYVKYVVGEGWTTPHVGLGCPTIFRVDYPIWEFASWEKLTEWVMATLNTAGGEQCGVVMGGDGGGVGTEVSAWRTSWGGSLAQRERRVPSYKVAPLGGTLGT